MRKFLILIGVALTLPLTAMAEDPPAVPDTNMDRQTLRSQQRVLTPQEQSQGEQRLDQIDRKARTDPRAAREMHDIYKADQSLSTINRPIPPGPPSANTGRTR